VRQVDRLDRQAIRHDFEQRFRVTRQAEQYEQLYLRLLETHDSNGSHQPLQRPCSPRDPQLHAA
jgi:hypothetical protein